MTMCRLKNTRKSYGLMAQTLHWLIFVLFVGMFVAAEIMMDMEPGPDKWQLYGLHKSFGIVLLFLVFARISWRMANVTPEDVAGMSKWQSLAAHGVHYALYVAMLAMPISGYLMSMGGGHGITVFGVWSVPDLVGENKPLGSLAHSVHHYTSLAVYGLVAVHLAAALYHHFIKKDEVLHRMLPLIKKR